MASQKLPQAAASGKTELPVSKRPARYSRWRVATLTLVYVLMAAHFVHWRIAGKTLAPVELSETMQTLELGIVTAGFVLMVLAFLSAAIFGRFFCGWACHIVALEDLCSWMLRKVGIRPKPLRSRVLVLVPVIAMVYMFIWPQLVRIFEKRPPPGFRIVSDAEGWASFVTSDFWRSMPDVWVIVLTLLVCGFVIVYVLGSRAFCFYGCPYGVILQFADRFAPARIVDVDRTCEQCAKCTSVCLSGVRVHEEIKDFGMVVNPDCMKDLDCVAACPVGAIHYSFSKPSLFKSWTKSPSRKARYDFSIGEEVLMAVTFVVSLLIYRDLYDAVPFLMTLGVGAIAAYLAVVALRMVRQRNVKLGHLSVKHAGALTRTGAATVALGVVGLAFTAHSAFIRYNEYFGARHLNQASERFAEGNVDASQAELASALGHLSNVEKYGLVHSVEHLHRLAEVHGRDSSPENAEPYLREILQRKPREFATQYQLATLLLRLGRVDEAYATYSRVTGASATYGYERQRAKELRAAAHERLGSIDQRRGQIDQAIAEYEVALNEDGKRVTSHLALGELLAHAGRIDEAQQHFEAVIEIEPNSALAYNNLGTLLASRGQLDSAAARFRRAIELQPDFAHPHFNLGRILISEGRNEEAAEHFRRAAELDPHYAELLGANDGGP